MRPGLRPKRLLFLLPFPPRLDARHGGGRATAQLLARLATRHRVALLYLRAPSDPPLDTTLQERCELAEAVMRPDPGFSLSQGWSRINSLLQGMPLWAAGSSVAGYGRRLRALAGAWQPDIVQIEYHVMGQYLFALDGCPAPRVLTEYEPGAKAARELLDSHRGLTRPAYWLSWLAWDRFEGAVIRQVDAVVAHGASLDGYAMKLEGDVLHRMTDAADRRPVSAFAGQRAHAVAGIGDPNRFFLQLVRQGVKVVPHPFPDHHRFEPGELDFGDEAPVLMTEKDAVKLRGLGRAHWWVLPVTAKLDPAFCDWLLEKLHEWRRSKAA